MQELDSIRNKQKISSGVRRVSAAAQRPSIGVGWIVLNDNVDDYVRYCIETSTVTIITAEHEIIQRCFVTRSAIQEIKFPETTSQKGSLIVWCSSPLSSSPIVFGVLNTVTEKNSLQKSNSFQLERNLNDDNIIIEGVADGGVINIIARSKTGGKINIKALNNKLLSELDVYVQGDINIDAENSINIRTDKQFVVKLDTYDGVKKKDVNAEVSYVMGVGFTLKDEFGNVVTTTENKVRVQTVKDGVITILGDQQAVEKALLGESTVNTLKDILDSITAVADNLQNLVVNVSTGNVLPITSANMVRLKSKVSKIKTGLEKLKSKNLKIS
jgi:hypothetical protein